MSDMHDTVILASNLEDLQFMMNRIVKHGEEHDLCMNVFKTKLLVFAKTNINANLTINGTHIEQIESFKYLDTTINNQCDSKKEIRTRIEKARKAFINIKQFCTRSELSLQLQVRMSRCYINSVLL